MALTTSDTVAARTAGRERSPLPGTGREPVACVAVAISDEQAEFDARFALIVDRFLHRAPTSLPRCEDLTEQDFTDGDELTFSYDELTAEPGRGDPGE